MKIKKKLLTVISICTILVTVISCSKRDLKRDNCVNAAYSSHILRPEEKADNPEKVVYYAEHFLNDSSMALVFQTFMSSSINMRGILYNAGGDSALTEWDKLIQNYSAYSTVNDFYYTLSIDTIMMKEKHAETFASWINLLVKNPGYNDLSMNDQELVLYMLQKTLTDKFEEQNPDNILVMTIRGMINSDPTVANKGITMSEATGCLVGAVAGQIINGWGLIKELVAVINGTNLGWSGIKAVCGSALSTIMGSNVAGMAISFGICMAWAYFF